MLKGIELIVFDLYDTLIHRSDNENPFNYLKSKLKDPTLLYTMTEGFLTMESSDFFSLSDSLFTSDFDRDHFEKIIAEDVAQVKLFSETLEVLDELKKRSISLMCASNLSQHYIKSYYDLLDEHLPPLMFSCVEGFRKPHLKVYEMALNTHTNPEQILFVGDSLASDYLIPKKLEMKAILIDRKGKHKGVEDRIGSLRELL